MNTSNPRNDGSTKGGNGSTRQAARGEWRGGAQPEDEKPRLPGFVGSRTVVVFERFGRWLALVAVFVAVVVMVAPDLLPNQMPYRLGDRVSDDITALVSFPVVDIDERERREQAYLEQVAFQYEYRRDAAQETLENVRRLLDRAQVIRGDFGDAADSEAAQELVEWMENERQVRLEMDLSRQVIQRLARSAGEAEERPPYEVLADLRGLAEPVRTLYARRVVVEDRDQYWQRYEANRVSVANMPEEISPRPGDVMQPREIRERLRETEAVGEEFRETYDSADQTLLLRLLDASARPNVVYSPEMTDHVRDAEVVKIRSETPPRLYHKGYLLVKRGESIGQEQIRLLRKMYDTYNRMHYKRLLAIMVYVGLLCGMVFYYMRLFRADITFTARNVLVVSLPLVIALALGALAQIVVDPVSFPDASGYAFPAAIIGMLAVILLDSRSAVLLVTIGSLAFSVRTGLDFKVFLVSLVGGYVSIVALTGVQERREMMRAGLFVGLANAVTILLVHFIDDPKALRLDLTPWGIGNGLVAGVVTMPALLLFERLFGVVTDIRLLELTGLDHPLLQDLEQKVPGSFQHSLNVCKLAEAAAKAIGANYLLVRAGTYYHDIGKILKPKYFGENLVSVEEKSLHAKISPYMSAMVIKNHVKGGMEIARKHRLPARVVDFIPQHHGTTIIAYFYNEALKRFENSQSTDPVRESDFRYPGPKPQTIETAIVMLADSVEATVTSRFTSLSINEDELRMCVQRIITTKFEDGQFDECNLTLQDLHRIRESFIKTLLSRFHHRVAYPSRTTRSGPAAATPRDRLARSDKAREEQRTEEKKATRSR